AQITATALQNALEGLTDEIGPGSVLVELETDTVAVPNRVHITLSFRGALARGPQPLIEVEAGGANLVSADASPRALLGRITPNELAWFDTQQKRQNLIQEIDNGIRGHFLKFDKGIEFTTNPAQAFLEVTWDTNSGPFKLGEISSASV